MLNNNQAYKWMSEWLDRGGWYLDSDDGVWGVFLGLSQFSQSQPDDTIGFRDDIKQLLADAEAGRKMREGV
jgi:hypothetical protein